MAWFTSRPSRLKKGFGASSQPKKHGFSEDALNGLADLDARVPPAEVETRPAFAPSYKRTERLSKGVAAGGGLVIDGDGNKVPHY